MMLQKMLFAVRAKPGLTRAQALDHLRSRHGPLLVAAATNRRRLKTYVQNCALDFDGIPALTDARDWIVESWRDPEVVLPDPPEAPDAILVREDEARFPDRATVLAVDVIEAPVWRKSDGMRAPIKLFTYFRRRSGDGLDEFLAAWADAAVALAAHPAFYRHAASYVQNIAVPGPGAPRTATSAPSAPAAPVYDGIDIWRFADVAAVRELFDDPGFAEALRRFEIIAQPQSLFRLITEEVIVFDDAGFTSTS